MSNQTVKVIIGLTGNIATGKSAVLRMASDMGATTIDADKIVHELMDYNDIAQQAVADAFGESVRRSNGRINRSVLGGIVFSDDDALEQLEEIVHPMVRAVVYDRILNAESEIVFIEAIKLLEGPMADLCHQIWVTRCSNQKQLERLRVCRGMETVPAMTRIKSQSSQEDKVAMSDVVIETDGFMSETMSQFEMAWQRLPEPALVELPDADSAPVKKVVMKTRAAPSARAGQKVKLERPPATPPIDRPDDLDVRRARPSDIPSILLLIQKATDGSLKMSRSELLMALSERGYFIGQLGDEVTTIIGWHIDTQIARIDELFVHPLEAIGDTTTAVIEDIEKSADAHICENIMVFLPKDAPDALRDLFLGRGYITVDAEVLPQVWQVALKESQPENSDFFLKVLREDRLKRS